MKKVSFWLLFLLIARISPCQFYVESTMSHASSESIVQVGDKIWEDSHTILGDDENPAIASSYASNGNAASYGMNWTSYPPSRFVFERGRMDGSVWSSTGSLVSEVEKHSARSTGRSLHERTFRVSGLSWFRLQLTSELSFESFWPEFPVNPFYNESRAYAALLVYDEGSGQFGAIEAVASNTLLWRLRDNRTRMIQLDPTKLYKLAVETFSYTMRDGYTFQEDHANHATASFLIRPQ